MPPVNSCRIVLPLIAAVAVALWAFVLDPIAQGWTIPCPWYEVTGTKCPGCGLQRATHALLHGDIAAALRHNLLSLLLLPLTIAAFVVWYLQRCLGMSERSFDLPAPLTWALAVLIIAYWILRNIPGSGFE
jgi:hypothetical protein